MGLSIHISKIDLQEGIFSLKKPSELLNFMKLHVRIGHLTHIIPKTDVN